MKQEAPPPPPDMHPEFLADASAITGDGEKLETVGFSLLKALVFQNCEAAALLTIAYARSEPLRIGQTVRIAALSKAKDYNGRIGIVCGNLNKRERYPVIMWDTKKILGLRGENLLRVLGGGSEMRPRVLVIGAGAAGLAAAKFLQDSKINVAILEARKRLGGRMCTLKLDEKKKLGLGSQYVDMGASYIHNCDNNNEIFRIALKDKPVCAVGANNRWADTELARWFDEKTGEEMSVMSNSKVHLLNWKIGSAMTRIARKLGQGGASNTDMKQVFEDAKKDMISRVKMKLTDQEQKMLHKIETRMWGYVSRLEDTASELVRHLPQDEVDLNDIIGSELHNMQYAMGLDVRIAQTDNPKVGVVDPADGPGDRLLSNGYGPFLVKHLSKGVRCVTGKSIERISINHLAKGKGSGGGGKRRKRQVMVRCRDGTSYTSDYVLLTVPLGVLKSKNPNSSIQFDPKLTNLKMSAIESLGSGVHGKIVLRFAKDDVFWPQRTPQLVPLDQRFHILNLHAYGKTGVLCAHVWPPFADGWNGLTDQQVVDELLDTLKGMFWREKKSGEFKGKLKLKKDPFPQPEDYIVGRWDSDPFSLGSYSYLKLGATWQQVEHLAAPFPSKDPHIFFAGEATSLEGIQCVTGAYKSGERAAKQVLACIANKHGGSRLRRG